MKLLRKVLVFSEFWLSAPFVVLLALIFAHNFMSGDMPSHEEIMQNLIPILLETFATCLALYMVFYTFYRSSLILSLQQNGERAEGHTDGISYGKGHMLGSIRYEFMVDGQTFKGKTRTLWGDIAQSIIERPFYVLYDPLNYQRNIWAGE